MADTLAAHQVGGFKMGEDVQTYLRSIIITANFSFSKDWEIQQATAV